MLTIINNNMGNIKSVANALQSLDVKYIITDNKTKIKHATSIIFPGVGAFPEAMKNLKKNQIDQIIIDKITNEKIPFLGICLGMQILFQYSEEIEKTKGLNIIKGVVKKIKSSKKNKVPHVGWNNYHLTKPHPLFKNISKNASFYYDHSYFVKTSKVNKIANLNYLDDMTIAVNKDNIYGVQFHPEKSQKNGLKLLRNFINLSN